MNFRNKGFFLFYPSGSQVYISSKTLNDICFHLKRHKFLMWKTNYIFGWQSYIWGEFYIFSCKFLHWDHFSHSSRKICICKGMIQCYMDLGNHCKRIQDFLGGLPTLEVVTWNMIAIYKVKCMILGVLIIQGCYMISMTLFIV